LSTISLTCQLVVFSLGKEEYALPITRVQEIIHYTEPRAVASSTPWIRGVISLRGNVIPVCDLAERLGLTTERGEEAKIILVEMPTGTAGVIVDDVHEVLTLDTEQLEHSSVAGVEIIEAIAKIDERLVVLLNPDGILAALEPAA
jgi:purine-binding chemotaxis protein CheW